MTAFSKTTTAALKTLIKETIASFGDDPVTNAATVTKALPRARMLCEDEYDAVIAAALRPMVRSALSHSVPAAYDRAPTLLPGIELPYRIAVPAIDAEIDPDQIDEDATGIRWLVLHRCSIAEVARNVAMRDAHIAGSLTERDRVNAVLVKARAFSSDPHAIVGDVLATVAA
jgi:hypothetical protein